MSEAAVGAKIGYCGHNAIFIGDIYRVGNVNVIRSNLDLKNPKHRKNGLCGLLLRGDEAVKSATHWITDFPNPGFWRADLGVFVIPEKQCKKL